MKIDDIDENNDIEDIDTYEETIDQRIPKMPIQDQTNILRWYTELETQLERDPEFYKRNQNNIRGFKFLSLGNITNPQERVIIELGRMKTKRFEDMGLYEEAEHQSIENDAYINLTRSKDGFFQKELGTHRQIWDEKTNSAESEKKSRMKLFFKGRKKEDIVEDIYNR